MGFVYLAALVVGGVLVVGSLVTGLDDHELDADADGELDADADGAADVWLPFASLRFWTFVLAFGGLTGTLLTFFALAPPWLTAVLALGVGWVCGAGVSWAIRRLRRDEISSEVREADYVGASARVLLPVGRGRTGKVRVEVRGRSVDAIAETEDEGELPLDGEVLVYDVREDGVLLVTRRVTTEDRTRREI